MASKVEIKKLILPKRMVFPPIKGRAAGMGYGNRVEFSKIAGQSPPPSKYAIPSTFDSGSILRKHRGFTFGVAGDRSASLANIFLSIRNPGPGQYRPYKEFGQDGKAATLKKKAWKLSV